MYHQYSQFGRKLFNLVFCNLAKRLGAGHNHGRTRPESSHIIHPNFKGLTNRPSYLVTIPAFEWPIFPRSLRKNSGHTFNSKTQNLSTYTFISVDKSIKNHSAFFSL